MNNKHRATAGLWAIAIAATLSLGCDSAKEAAPKDKSAAKSDDAKAKDAEAKDAKPPAKADADPAAKAEPAKPADDHCKKLVDKLHGIKAPFFEEAKDLPMLVEACQSEKIADNYKATIDCIIGAADMDAVQKCDQADPMLKAWFKPLMDK